MYKNIVLFIRGSSIVGGFLVRPQSASVRLLSQNKYNNICVSFSMCDNHSGTSDKARTQQHSPDHINNNNCYYQETTHYISSSSHQAIAKINRIIWKMIGLNRKSNATTT